MAEADETGRLDFPFTGIPSFPRSAIIHDPAGLEADIAVLGMPCDEDSPFMPGSRFGPRSIREHSHGITISNQHAFCYIRQMANAASITQAGIRSIRGSEQMLTDALRDGNRGVTMEELLDVGAAGLVSAVPENARFCVSIDIDALDRDRLRTDAGLAAAARPPAPTARPGRLSRAPSPQGPGHAAAAHGVSTCGCPAAWPAARTTPGSDADLLAGFPPGLSLFGLGCLEADLEGILGTRVDLIPPANLKPG